MGPTGQRVQVKAPFGCRRYGIQGGIPSQQDSESIGGASDILEVEEEEEEDTLRAPDSPGHLLASASHNSLAAISSPLTREALEHAAEFAAREEDDDSSITSSSSGRVGGGGVEPRLPSGFERGSRLRNRESSGAEGTSTWGGESSVAATSELEEGVSEHAPLPGDDNLLMSFYF